MLEKTVNEMAAGYDITRKEIRKNLMDMYVTYANEWQAVKGEISNSYPEPIIA